MNRAEIKELRRSTRRAIDLNVIVYPGDTDPFMGTIYDFSTGGLFIETRTIPAIETPVILRFRLGSARKKESYRISAIVVRHSIDGIGLMFDEYDNNTIKSLRQMYHEAVKSKRY